MASLTTSFYLPPSERLTSINVVFSLADPHVRIAGRPDDVKEAKAKVMSALDVRVSATPYVLVSLPL